MLVMSVVMMIFMPRREPRTGRRSTKRPWLVAATLFITVLAWAGPASAQLPNDASAVDQYVEDMPEAGGSSGVGIGNGSAGGAGGTGSGGGAALPSGIASALQRDGGRDAEILREVATSPVFGAPQDRLGGKRGSREAREAIRSGELGGDTPGGVSGGTGGLSAGDALTTAIGAVQGGDSGRLAGLLAALAVISAGALTAAGLRHRRRSL